MDTAITINGTTLFGKDVFAALDVALKALPLKPDSPSHYPLGDYQGLRFGMRLFPFGPPDLYLQGSDFHYARLSRDALGPKAILNGLTKLANSYEEVCQHLEDELTLTETQLRDYQARIGKPFLHDTYRTELESLRDQLKASLSGPVKHSSDDSLPDAAELAMRIHALKSTNTIEGTPERLGSRTQTVEEPVTTQIRKRMDAILTPNTNETDL